VLRGNIDVGRDYVNNGDVIIRGDGDAHINVNRDMTLSGSGSRVSFNNPGLANMNVQGKTLIDKGAQLVFNNGGEAKLSVADNLTVGEDGAGVIRRTGNSSTFFIIDPTNPGSDLVVQNPGSKIVDDRDVGRMQISAEDTISVLNGAEIRTASGINGKLLLFADQLIMQRGTVKSAGSLDMGKSGKPLSLSFSGSGSSITSVANFGVDGRVFYTLPETGPFGNIIGSKKGTLFVAPDNLQAIKDNLLNLGIERGNIDNPINGNNVFLNAFQSDQPGNLQNITTTVVSKPIELPVIPPDPCGEGSTFEVKNSDGVVPVLSDVMSFSVFPESAKQPQKPDEVEVELENISTETAKTAGCSKGL
jgi:hypothetical protein